MNRPGQSPNPGILRLKSDDVLTVEMADFLNAVKLHVFEGDRLVSFFGSPGVANDSVWISCVTLSKTGRLQLVRGLSSRGGSYPALTKDYPQFSCFEREIFEQYRIKPLGHPWLKPIRYSDASGPEMTAYPFYHLEGKEIHEVGVGPVHAGVIEPGHFRFSCYGENVEHLEIQLGYQHRAIESLLVGRPLSKQAPLIETVAGDSSVGHTLAYCRAVEQLGSISISAEAERLRGIALELERVAMHLVGLAGMSTDIAFLPGTATYGRLRTSIINATMRLCGSRFGKGWFRPGEVRFGISDEKTKDLLKTIALVKKDIRLINDLFSHSVKRRLQGTGVVTKEDVTTMGFVGMVARSSGVSIDFRADSEPYVTNPIDSVYEKSGDCWARACIRIKEIEASLKWIERVLTQHPNMSAVKVEPPSVRPHSLAVAVVEGWRGEIVHVVETDGKGAIRHYKIQDPSFRNWFALALSVRKNGISDFPICNKSFDLSYCGNDL